MGTIAAASDGTGNKGELSCRGGPEARQKKGGGGAPGLGPGVFEWKTIVLVGHDAKCFSGS